MAELSKLSYKWPIFYAIAGIVSIVSITLAYVYGDGQRYGMYTTVQWVLYGIATILTFLSYHIIPNALDSLRVTGRGEMVSDIATSTVFTAFVRSCGNDHLIMYVGMLFHSYGMILLPHGEGLHNTHIVVGWVLLISVWLVTIYSCLSGYIVYTSSRQAHREASKC